MCGRVATTTPLEQIAALVGARGPLPPWRPRYNQPPGEPVANVVEANGVRRIEPFLWGIRGRDPRRPYVNMRSETVPRSRAFARRRSLVFVDGFYEWDRSRQPYYVRERNGRPLALAAVYDESPELRRFAILTTAPNRTVAQVHPRMPAILPAEAWTAWLDPRYPHPDALRSWLRPFPDEPLVIHPVARLANSPKNDRPELLQATGEMPRAAALPERAYALFERQKALSTQEVAEALGIGEDEAAELLRGMTGTDSRLGKWWLTKWKR